MNRVYTPPMKQHLKQPMRLAPGRVTVVLSLLGLLFLALLRRAMRQSIKA